VRAADRLRLDGARLGGRALLDMRETRGRLGRAMRVARRRRALGDTQSETSALLAPTVVVAPRRSRRRWILAAIAAALLGLVLLLLLWPRTQTDEDPGGGLPALQQQVEQVVRKEILRGRSVALPPTPEPSAVVVAQPTLTPLPQIPFTTQRPNPSPGAGGVPGGTGSGTGGSGGGTGSGAGGGSGLGGPRPTQPPPPASIPPGYGRFTVIVLDQFSGAAVPDVCLVIGSGSCGPAKPHTDGAGRWWVDLPVSQPNTNFDVTFILQGYATDYRRFVVLKGQSVTYIVRLNPTTDRN
jgi:hypothetical protein